MALEMRPITMDDFVAYCRAFDMAFGGRSTDEEIERWRPDFEPDRSLAIFEGARIVATAGANTFELTLPGLTLLPVAGVVAVSVLPTHRRRGLLAQMMRRQLEDVRARGEAIAILTASESVIYGRFGYGAATSRMNVEIERSHARLAHAPELAGGLRMVEQDEALPMLVALYDELRLHQPGAVNRTLAFWQAEMLPPAPADAGPRYFAVYESAPGRVDGAVYYRVERQWVDSLSQSTLQIGELLAATPAARAALWRYCVTLDLTARIRATSRPVDEPLRWMLADPRRLRVTAINDDLWLRLLDIRTALAARRYSSAGRLVLAIGDPFLPENTGIYTLECSTDGAECRRTQDAADLTLDVADLGAAYLGGVRFSTLAAASRVVEHTPGALARADALFASDPLPYCGTPF